MPINLPSDHDDIEPSARLAHGVEALSDAWRQLPPPAKLLAWAAALAFAAPALRHAADTLNVEPADLLPFTQRT